MTGFIDDYGGATDVPLQGVEDAQWAKMFPVPKGTGDVYSEDGPYGQFATPRIAYRLHYHLSNRVRFAFRSYALVPLNNIGSHVRRPSCTRQPWPTESVSWYKDYPAVRATPESACVLLKHSAAEQVSP